MTKQWNLRNTIFSVGHITATHELAANSGTSSTDFIQPFITVSPSNVAVWTVNETGEPGVASWPAASGGDPYAIALDVTSMGSAVALDEASAFHRFNSTPNTTVDSSTAGSWDSTTGTGLKTYSDTTWAPSGSTTTDRLAFLLIVTTSNTMMSNDIGISSLNSTSTFIKGPFSTSSDVTVTPSPVTVPLAIPTPTVAAGRVLTPSPVAIPLVIPDPTVSAAGAAVTVTPDPVAIPLAIPAPTATAGRVLTPSPVTVQLAIPTPTVSAGVAIAPDPVAISLVLPAPTVAVGAGDVTVTPDPVAIPLAIPAPTVVLGPAVTIAAFCVRNDDGEETTATWKAAQNTDVNVAEGEVFRIRYLLQETAGVAISAGDADFILRRRLNGGAWLVVGAESGTVLLGSASAFVDDVEATTQQLTGGSGSFVGGQVEASNARLQSAITAGNYTEHEFTVVMPAADVTDGDTVDNELVQLDDGLGGPANQFPVTQAQAVTITVGSGAVTVTPDPVAVPLAVPAPTVAAGRVLTPSPVAVPLVISAPTVAAGRVVTPDPVPVPLVIPSPTIVVNALVTPSPVAIPLSIPDPTVTAGRVVTPDPVTIPLVIPAPTVTTGTAVTVTPDPVAIPLAIPAPTVTAGRIVTPDPVAIALTIPAPTIAVGAALLYPPEQSLTNTSLPSVPSVPALLTPTSQAEWPNITYQRISDVAGTRHVYSRASVWNSDQTMILLGSSTGTEAIHDGATYEHLHDLPFLVGMHQWANTDPNKIYGTWIEENYLRSQTWNGSSWGASPDIEHTFTGYTSISLGDSEGGISDDDNTFVLMTVDALGNHGMLVYDRGTDSVVAEHDFGPSSWPDTCFVSRSGDYVIVYWSSINGGGGDGPGMNQGLHLYDRDLTHIRQITQEARHCDPGRLANGDEVIVMNDYGGKYYRLDDNTLVYLFESLSAFPHNTAFTRGHVSCRNTDRDGYAYFSVYDTVTTFTGSTYGRDQIVAAKLDDPGVVEVFGWAYHRLNGDAGEGEYWASPMAVPSRDGTRVLWASEHGDTTDPFTVYAYVSEAIPDVILTPSPVTIPLAIPTPTVTAGRVLTPSPVTVPLALPAPTVTAGRVLTPSPVSVAITTVAPTVRAGVAITPSPVAITLVIPDPTVTAAIGDIILTPDPVALELVIPAPTLAVGRIITPTPVAIALALPAPTVAGLSLAIAGKTRDRNGSAIGNVTVRAFRTADDVFVGETTSDFTGSFSVEVGAGEHYLVGYKAGSPDIAGTTVNTLVGS